MQGNRHCCASRVCGKSAILYDVQRKFQLGWMVIVIAVKSLNLYKTEPGTTFVWIDMKFSEIFTLTPPFSPQAPFWTNLWSAPAVFVNHVTANVVPIWLVLTSESATEEGEVIRMVIFTDNRNLSYLPCRVLPKDREVAIDNVNACW